MSKEQGDNSEALASSDGVSSPAKLERVRYAGGIDGLIRQSVAALLVGDDRGESGKKITKLIAEESDALRDELAGPHPSMIEKLLSERVATCSALASMFDFQYVNAIGKKNAASTEFWGKEADRANNRVLKAVATLAMVRKVQGPIVQVNVAEKQINVAGSVIGSDQNHGR